VASNGKARIAIVCGRQIRARGGLEVLALGTLKEFSDGRPVTDTVAAVRSSGALPVIPWGFGKWLGNRGRIVREALRSAGSDVLAVGDNGSRLAVLGTPTLIRESQLEGFRVLPGTDPFPFGRDYRRVGRFGFVAETTIDESAPWDALHAWLDGLKHSPHPFGKASGPMRFLINQVGIQVYNRVLRSTRR
jgi:hypothetical protein